MSTDGVHVTHCCVIHGCKYGWSDEEENACPVSNGTLVQAYLCEWCQSSKDIRRAIIELQDELVAVEGLEYRMEEARRARAVSELQTTEGAGDA